MSDTPKDRDGPPLSSSGPIERVAYVLPEHSASTRYQGELDIGSLIRTISVAKFRILGITAAFAVASVVYALWATEWYRTEVVLAPTEERTAPGLAGQIGGLASLAGVNLDDGGSTAEAIATLESRELAAEFIQENDLVSVLFARDWDLERHAWRDDDPEKWPDIRDAIEYFHEDVLNVSQDRQTSIITMSITWSDPDLAARWGNQLAKRVNDRMRARALREAEANVSFLQAELTKTNIVTMQQSIGSLLETEMQKLMLARGNEEFAFRVIDAARAPKYPEKPNRPLIIAIGTFVGALIAIFGVLMFTDMKPRAQDA